MVLEESITAIKGIGNKTAALLNKLGIYTKRDIIKYFPRNYDKYEKITPISSLKNGMTAVISAMPASAPILKQMGKKSILICEVSDGSGKIELNWFNMPFLKNKLSKGVHNIFRGRVSRNGKFIRIVQPEILTEAEYRRRYLLRLLQVSIIFRKISKKIILLFPLKMPYRKYISPSPMKP